MGKDLEYIKEKAALDSACKRLLANKAILAWILKDCVEEFKDCEIDDIAEKYIEGEPQIETSAVNPNEVNSEIIRGISNEDSSLTEGNITYDIRFMALAPKSDEMIELIINVEAQNDFYPGYPLIKRAIYYCSRMVSSQYGVEFTQSQYGKIKKVYSIWVCTNPPKNRENSITSYSFTENNLVGDVKESKENYDLMTAVMICLGNDKGKNYDRVLKLLEVLLSSTTPTDRKKQILQNDFKIKMTQKLDEEVSAMCNISDGVEARGIAKGIAKGMAQGMAQGIESNTINSIKNLMKNLRFTAEQAMAALNVPEPEYDKYKILLNKSK